MGNKLSKFLIGLTGIMTMALGVLALKFQKESQEIKRLQENLKGGLAAAEKVSEMIDVQKQLEADRLENLKQVDNARIGAKTETKTQTVVIPGKTVKQTTTTKASSSKTTKTS